MTTAGDQHRTQADFARAGYVGQARWASYYHQITEIMNWKPTGVLEVGVGPGIVAERMRASGLQVVTMDLNAAASPDAAATVTSLPVRDDAVDVAACFEVLEHLPFADLEKALRELRRVARRAVILSVPDADRVYLVSFRSPVWKGVRLRFRLPFRRRHRYDGSHHWEVGKKGYELDRVLAVIERSGLDVLRTFRPFENPYHRFFVLEPRK